MFSDVSVGVQSRISAFEAMASSKPANTSASKSAPSLLDAPLSPSSKTYFPITPSPPSSANKPVSRSSSPSSPILTRKPSSIDLKDWVVDDGPLPYAPRQKKYVGAKPTFNGGAVRHASEPLVGSAVSPPPPLIQFESSPPNSKTAPPLPPRKSSYSSLKSVSVSNSSSSSLPRSPNTVAIPLPLTQMRKKSDSLTVDHSYPPLGKLGISAPSRGASTGHVQASSISSFHSVSLSSDGGTDPTTPGSLSNFVTTYPIDRDDREAENNHEPDNVSLDDSFENVSTSSIVSPSLSSLSNDWAEYVQRPEPPKLPQRPRKSTSGAIHPVVARSSSGSASSQVPYIIRPPPAKPTPPPPPSRTKAPASNRSSLTSTITTSSDRSSIISTATSRTSISSVRPALLSKPSAVQRPLVRPLPIPPAARQRYEIVFEGNVLVQRRTAAQTRSGLLSPPPGRERRAAGWRGLSVDLVTNPEELPSGAGTKGAEEVVGPDERLDGRTIAFIWRASKLDRSILKGIWNECDTAGSGSLNREAFVKGMWRIDEELRKAQLRAQTPSYRPPKRSVALLS